MQDDLADALAFTTDATVHLVGMFIALSLASAAVWHYVVMWPLDHRRGRVS